jgi:hypothetical protein
MAALLFDQIYFLETNFFRPPEERLGTYVPGRIAPSLQDIGVFREIGPDLMGFGMYFGRTQPVLDTTLLKEIQASIIADLNNPELNNLVAKQQKLFWRIVSGQYLFWNGLGILFEISNDQRHDSVFEVLTSRPAYYQPLIKNAGYKKEVQSYEEARIRNVREDLTVRVPFLAAEALMVTVSLCACSEFGLIPFTDNPFHHTYLMLKMKSIMKQISSQTDFVDVVKGINYTAIGNRSLEINLPKLENLTPEKVIGLRQNCRDELTNFRLQMLKVVYRIENDPWSNEYEHELQEIIDTEVHPAIIELENKLLSLKQKFGIGLIQKGLTTAPLPLLLNVFVHFPMIWALPISVGAISFAQYLEYLQQKSEVRRNGFSFLLNFQ